MADAVQGAGAEADFPVSMSQQAINMAVPKGVGCGISGKCVEELAKEVPARGDGGDGEKAVGGQFLRMGQDILADGWVWVAQGGCGGVGMELAQANSDQPAAVVWFKRGAEGGIVVPPGKEQIQVRRHFGCAPGLDPTGIVEVPKGDDGVRGHGFGKLEPKGEEGLRGGVRVFGGGAADFGMVGGGQAGEFGMWVFHIRSGSQIGRIGLQGVGNVFMGMRLFHGRHFSG